MTSQVPTDAPPQVAGRTYWDKGWQKCKEQPFVPLGVGLTTIALLGASQQFRLGNREALNRFLRFRVVAQGVTIAACVIGSLVYTKDKTIEKAVKRQEELEKIRVAGTRPAAAPEPAPAPALTGETSSTAAPPSGTPPAAGVELWKKWGVGTGGKP